MMGDATTLAPERIRGELLYHGIRFSDRTRAMTRLRQGAVKRSAQDTYDVGRLMLHWRRNLNAFLPERKAQESFGPIPAIFIL